MDQPCLSVITQAGMHPYVSALVYVAARAPDAEEDDTALEDISGIARVRQLSSMARRGA
jgi:hypothetical protein